MNNIVNPFEQRKKKIDWTKQAKEKYSAKNESLQVNSDFSKAEKNVKNNKTENKVKRVTKSFKVYSGLITREFDKRVNKLQVKFDDLNYNKDYVDSGKYIMFLMALAEKAELYNFYCEVNEKGELEINKEEILKRLKEI